jgi:hypothetical protein
MFGAFRPHQAVDRFAQDEAIRLTFAAFGPVNVVRLYELAQRCLDKFYSRCTNLDIPDGPANCGPLLSVGTDVYRHILSFLDLPEAYRATSLLSKEIRARALPLVCAGRPVEHIVSAHNLRTIPFLRARHICWPYVERISLPAWTEKLDMSYDVFMYNLKYNIFAHMPHVREIRLNCVAVGSAGGSIEHLDFDLSTASLPPRLESLTLNGAFDLTLVEGFLPPTLRVLILGDTYNRKLYPNVLPPSLRVLRLGASYATYIAPNVLPPGLLHLDIGDRFNHSLSNKPILPSSLQILECSYDGRFDREVPFADLPILPSSLQVLECGYDGRFDREVPFADLPNLRTLLLGKRYLHEFAQWAGLTSLRLNKYSQDLHCIYWPAKLLELTIHDVSDWVDFSALPHLQKLDYQGSGEMLQNIKPLPPGLQTVLIHLHKLDYMPLHPILINLKKIPQSVTSLKITGWFDQVIEPGDLPQGLMSLTLGGIYNSTFKVGSLPPALTSLDMQYAEHYRKGFAPNVFPPSLLYLQLYIVQSRHITFEAQVLPRTLRTFKIYGVSPNICKRGFPDSLRVLHFNPIYAERVYTVNLPPNLEELAIGNGTITFNTPMPNLRTLIKTTPDGFAEYDADDLEQYNDDLHYELKGVSPYTTVIHRRPPAIRANDPGRL